MSGLREAEEILERLVAETPQTNKDWLDFGDRLAVTTFWHAKLLEGAGRFIEAEAAYTKAVERRRHLVGAVKSDEGIGPGAEIRGGMNGYLSTRNNWAQSLNELGLFHLRRGQTELAAVHCAQARSVLEQMVAAHPEDNDAMNALARFLVTCPVETLRDPTRAIRLARKAVALFESRNYVGTLGAAQYRAGDYQAAVASLDRSTCLCLQEQQLDPTVQLFRAMAHSRVGNTEAARRYYDEAVREVEQPYYFERTLLQMLREEAAAVLGLK
jgi:tetratricopeptide (TPR) repeat protein